MRKKRRKILEFIWYFFNEYILFSKLQRQIIAIHCRPWPQCAGFPKPIHINIQHNVKLYIYL